MGFKELVTSDEFLTLKAPISQNGQTHSNNSSAKADELFECVWPFCEVANYRVKRIGCAKARLL